VPKRWPILTPATADARVTWGSVVPESPEALARFEREAKAVAAHSHPGILAIHDFRREGGTSFAVMELLGGFVAQG